MEGLQRIDRYLQRRPEARKEKAGLQWAANIAYVFDAYLFYRTEMMTEWQKNAPRRGDAAWQARLWKKLLKRWDLLHSDAPWSQNKAELFEQAMASDRSEEHTSELQSRGHLVCRLLLEKKKNMKQRITQ